MVEPPLIEDVFVCCTRFLRIASRHWPSPLTHQDAARITQGLLLTSSPMAKTAKRSPAACAPKSLGIPIAMAHPCLRVRSANDTCAAVRSANGFPNGSRMRKTRASSLRRLDASTVSRPRAPPDRTWDDNVSRHSRLDRCPGAGLHERRTFGDQHVRTPLQRLRGEAKGKFARQHTSDTS